MKEIREILDDIDRPIAFRRALVRLTGSVKAALMLSQAIYWEERVTREDGWFYKSIEEWQEETGLSRYAQETARKKCRKYLLSDLRGLPAQLYWKVDREVLKADLLVLVPDHPAQSLRETRQQEAINPQTSRLENDTRIDENSQADSGEPIHQAGDFHASINMKTESTTQNTAEINNKITAEKKEVIVDGEGEEEKEMQLLLLLLMIFIEFYRKKFPPGWMNS